MKAYLLFLFMAVTIGAGAQTFSSHPETFLKQIDKYLSSSNRTKTKEFIEVFTPVWLNQFSSDYQNKVVTTSNLIVEKRLTAYPHLYGYLFSTYSFVKNDQPESSFNSWHSTIDKLLRSKKVKSFKQFIEMCTGLFDDGTIFSNQKHVWGIRGGSYQFDFVKNNPRVMFEDVTLYCYVLNKTQSRRTEKYVDSIVVRVTKGDFQPLINKWTGRGGKVDWAKTGLDSSKNYVTITDYSMTLKGTKISSDSAEVHSDFYEKPLEGSFIDVAKSSNKDGEFDYPQFVSFSKKIVKKSILPEIDYVGGFALNGPNFTGVGFGSEPASLIFLKNGKSFVKASAMRFRINEEGVYSENCQTVIYLNTNDSIYHPSLIIKYDKESLDMLRDRKGLAQAPFSNTHHNVDMYVDRVVWYKSSNRLNLEWSFGTNNKLARFESKGYFDAELYSQLQGMSRVHPLVAVYGYYYKYDKKTYPVSEVANHMGLATEQIIPILLDLSNHGFISYNSDTKMLTVLPKTKKYIDARAGKSDYDDIVFVSDFNPISEQNTINPDGSENKGADRFNKRAKALNSRKKLYPNFGTIDLGTLDMSLNEVLPVALSETQRVTVFPDSGQLIMKSNRDFIFSGAISAGKAEIYLNTGAFKYDEFKINLSDVDVALFRVKPIFGGADNLVPMQSHISEFEGELLIDDSENKSGWKRKITNYPILTTEENSYVYYNHKSIFNGTYDSATFYFKINPFTFDSLDNFTEENMIFDGELRSSGIFPVFEEQIRIQEDYSFGFKTYAPEEGYRFYGNDAKYKNDIRLSNKGLRGSGEINFLTSNSKSDDFIFFADSTMGISQFTNISQSGDDGIDVPDIIGNNALVTYVPKQKLLKAQSKTESLQMYDKEVMMLGTTKLTPEGMTGFGATYFGKAEYKSEKFDFKQYVIDADTADFNLADIDTIANKEEITFATNNVNGHVDFEERKGKFESNDGTSIVEFPQNQYICYMDIFTWLMDDDVLGMEKKAKDNLNIDSDLDIAESNFFSTHPKQDSLNFRSPKARFDIKSKVLDCDKVEYVDIADARIKPAENKLIIRKNAKIDPLEKASIVANFITKYHTISNAYVEIKARRNYEANGDYKYINNKKEEQLIHFDKIKLDTAYQTVATGNIEKTANFKLSDRFDFYGDVNLKASTQFLNFDGATRINHECDQFAKNWMKFKTDIDPNNIQIPVNDNMKDFEGNDIVVGIVLRSTNDYDSLGVYPAFLSSLENKNDKILFTSAGVLSYNDQTKEYRIASAEKLINRAEKGNYISLHTQSCSMKGDGVVDLAVDMPDVEFKTVGTIEYNMANRKTSMNLSGSLSHYYDEKAMEMMSNAIIGTEELTGVDFNRTTLEQSIKELVDEKSAENFKSDYTIKGEVKRIPKAMQAPMYFTNLRLEWDDRNKAFVSKPITGIVNTYNTPIMKDFTVRVALSYSVNNADRGNKFMYKVDLPGNRYYYYHYERLKKETRLQVFTTDKLLETYLLEMKEDKKKQKKLSFDFSKKSIYIVQFKSLIGE